MRTIEFPLVVFDGDCGFCNRSVKWVASREMGERLRFTASTSRLAHEVLTEHGLEPDRINSIVFIDSGKCHLESDAVLEVAKFLKRPWNLIACFKIVPRPARDWLYRLVAANRTKLGNPEKVCDIPDETIRSRIIDR